jgi:hypothetical protein
LTLRVPIQSESQRQISVSPTIEPLGVIAVDGDEIVESVVTSQLFDKGGTEIDAVDIPGICWPGTKTVTLQRVKKRSPVFGKAPPGIKVKRIGILFAQKDI